jgi:hypothetical protein
MAEFKLGRIKFVWKNDWTTGTTYYKDDIVAYGGRTYLCVAGHTAAADFYTDLGNVPTKWNQFSDGQDWKGEWSQTTLYKENDIVKYGGYVYICNDGHTSSTTLEANQSDWDLFAESFDWKGAWVAATTYKVNDLVKYGGITYLCNTAHTAAATNALGLEQDQGKWDIFSKGVDWKGAWSTTTRYKIGDLVKYGGTTYVCNTGHTSAATASSGLELDQSKWDYFNQGIEYTGTWVTATRYKVNDVVKYGGGTFICITNHTASGSFVSDVANWNQFVEGIEFEGDWTSGTTYQPGDIVRYGGNSYIAKTSHISAGSFEPSTNTTDWDLFSNGFRLQGDWSGATAYKVGEIVRLRGFTYVAIADNTNQTPPNVTYWSKLNEGIDWQGDWTSATSYVLGDAVKYGPNSYICVLAHTSTTGADRPDNDNTGVYWNLLTAGNEESVLTTTGDLVYYSGGGPTRLPIGDEGQVLTVDTGLPTWKYFGKVENVWYVAPHGVNSPAPTYGSTIDKPWASIRYAAEQIEKGTENPNAAYLLKMNRAFIQREVTEWVIAQITAGTGIWAGFVNDSQALCERDTGLIVDAIVYDLTHTGNVKTIEAVESYFTDLGVLETFISDEEEQLVAAINYSLTLMGNVLSNTAPAQNYQALNGISAGDRTLQIIDATYTAEVGALAICQSLAGIITDALTAGDLDDLPAVDVPNFTIQVKTGQYYEVLPIIVPANTAIVGDELRSSRVSPAGKLVPTNDKAKSIATLTHLRSITDEIVTNTAVTPTSGNTETQDTTSQNEGNVGSSAAVTSVVNNVTEIKDILTNGLGAVDAFVIPSPTNWGSTLTQVEYASSGNPTGATSTYDNARAQILANTNFIKAEITAWIAVQVAGSIAPFSGSFTYDAAACARDVGYILDAMRYDLTYGGNYQTMIAAKAYYSFGAATFGDGEKEETLAAYAHLKSIVGDVITETSITPSSGNAETQDVSGTAGNAFAAAFGEERIQNIIDVITVDGDTTDVGYPVTINPDESWVSASLLKAKTALVTFRTTIQSDSLAFIKREYPTLEFNESTCSRDVGLIVDALGFDLMFGSNFNSIKAGMSYRRGITSTGVVIANQLAATQDILDFISAKCSKVVATGASVLAQQIWDNIISYANTGTEPIIVGTNSPTTDIDVINGASILLLNKEFLVAESNAYIDTTFITTATATTGAGTDTITVGDTSWMVAGDTIRFTGTVFGGVVLATTYYVHTVVNPTTLKISDTLGGAVKTLTTASGTMTLKWEYNSDSCENDVRNYIEAIAYDMVYTGNYKSVYAAKYYRNAFTGSKLENMYLVRNGCGVRNQTVTGLDGSSDGDQTGVQSALLPANEYGTQRPRAGAYVSLDPGWGPNDNRTWVTSRSTYVQNVTTFGTGATGQKIDGSLHAGGNDSIVSNDFTQVISDGIGAWITNLGRAELVSVFSYYAHIGYLAENGGKIRATNGNTSYGTFGCVAEGVDITEVPIEGEINNRGEEADVRSVITDGDDVLIYEFGNAGSEYSQATITTSGSGSGLSTLANEFRDGAVFNIRLTDPGDSSGTGGEGYLTAANLAQAGNTTQITLAAADIAGSGAYAGMSIYIISGTGAGQYGYINTYNAGSKIATVYKESTGTAGWDHVVPGTPIEAALDVTTSYEITPRIVLTAPPFTKTLASMPSSANWSDVVFGDGYAAYTALSASGGSGSLATFNVTRRQGVYSVEVLAGGALYAVGNTLTIAGTSLGGTSPANDLTITVDTATNPSGAITSVTASGTAVTAKYVALVNGSATGAYSLDGVTWSATTLPTATGPGASNQWTAIAYGVVSNVSYYVAIARESSVSAYSLDGINWTIASLNEVADWCDVAYGNGSFVAIAESDSSLAFRSVSTNGGATWSTNSVASGAKAITYGFSRFVLVEGNFSNSVAYSTSGATWTVTTLPSNDDSTESNWVDIAYGNGRYVAISDSSAMAAYSFDGATWYKSNLPGLYEWTSIGYGQGVFYVTSNGDYAASSPDGVTWTLRDGSHVSFNVTSTAQNTNPANYTARTLPASGYWTDVTWSGTRFVAVGYDSVGSTALTAYSTNGETWVAGTLPLSGTNWEYTTIAYNGTNQYVALIGGNGGTNDTATSADGITWSSVANAMTTNSFWKDMTYGAGRYVAIKGDSAAINYSTNGTTWTNAAISGGSSENSAIAYGNIGGTDYFVIVSGYATGSQTASYSTNAGSTWTSGTTLPSSDLWSDVAFGNGRFVAIAGGTAGTSTAAAYSTNGTTWTAATLPGAAANWNKVVYGGGAFTAFAYNSNRTAYSTDGTTWVEGSTLSSTANWAAAAYGNDRNAVLATGGTTSAASLNFVLNSNLLTCASTAGLNVNDRIRFSGTRFGGLLDNAYYYVTSVPNSTQFTVSSTKGGSNFVLSSGSGSMTSLASKSYVASALGNYQGNPRWVVLGADSLGVLNIRQGATARARAYVLDERLYEIWIHEPGSGYVTAPSATITDPNNIGSDATLQIRIGTGAIAQPTFINRGTGFSAASAEVSGNGYADNYQVSSFVGFKNLTDVPKAGSNVQIAGIDDVWYRLVNVTSLVTNPDGTYNATLQLSPAIGAAEAPEHETATVIRRRYSQVRLTGHDLLDVGTGNFTNTNYPGLPFSDPIPANEYKQSLGGRVFYTSTDQDGNFRVGGLFNVEQSTGVATLNADAFNIAGLNELSLGSVALGGSGATITEFSTDPFFTQDSDSIIPTQRAIRAYITSQIGGGGSSLNVNTLTAGVIYIAGQTIATTTNVQININTKVNFKGGIGGDALVLNYFLLNN